jgi:hypothetical protein
LALFAVATRNSFSFSFLLSFSTLFSRFFSLLSLLLSRVRMRVRLSRFGGAIKGLRSLDEMEETAREKGNGGTGQRLPVPAVPFSEPLPTISA